MNPTLESLFCVSFTQISDLFLLYFNYFSFIITEEIRFTQTPPQRIVTREHDLIYLHCEAAFDDLLDIAYVWKHNGEVLRDNHDGTTRIVCSLIYPIALVT